MAPEPPIVPGPIVVLVEELIPQAHFHWGVVRGSLSAVLHLRKVCRFEDQSCWQVAKLVVSAMCSCQNFKTVK